VIAHTLVGISGRLTREESLTFPATLLERLDHGAMELSVSDFREASQASCDGFGKCDPVTLA
jgi:hypothetical protein